MIEVISKKVRGGEEVKTEEHLQAYLGAMREEEWHHLRQCIEDRGYREHDHSLVSQEGEERFLLFLERFQEEGMLFSGEDRDALISITSEEIDRYYKAEMPSASNNYAGEGTIDWTFEHSPEGRRVRMEAIQKFYKK